MKTILDAVNTLKGVWPSESIQIIEIDGVEFSEKEFNDCVVECSNNFGLPNVTAIDWSKAPKNCDGYSVSSCMNGYWHLDNETLTPAPDFGIRETKFFHRVVAKPIYTQAMCDAGDLPSVGMKCLMTISKKDKGTAGYIEFKNEIGFLFRYADNNLCDFYESCINILFEPIDNQTPKKKAFDDYLDSEYNLSKNEFLEASSEDDIFVTKLESAFNAGVKWTGK